MKHVKLLELVDRGSHAAGLLLFGLTVYMYVCGALWTGGTKTSLINQPFQFAWNRRTQQPHN